jgi:hypothetical protein
MPRVDLGRPWVLRGLVIALAVVVGVVAYLATSGGDDEEPAAAPQAGEARIVSEEELADIASTAEYPVYWAGQLTDAELEVTDSGEAGVLVRYLLEDDDVGDALPGRIAVGSYPLADPQKALDNFAGRPGATVSDVPGVGKVVSNAQAASSVYFVDPENKVQVEVYAPSPKRAMSLVRSGQVVPVG